MLRGTLKKTIIIIMIIIIIIFKSEELGLELNTTKCEITYGDTSTPHDDPILKIFQCTEMEDLTLLGARSFQDEPWIML